MPTQKTRTEIEKEAVQVFGQFPSWMRAIPDPAVASFWDLLTNFQMGETAIPGKYKELIGLAVAGATRCKYCALFHTEAARLNGATDQEIAEANLMSGFTMMASTFLNGQQTDYDAFARETKEMVAYVRAHAPAPTSDVPHAARH